MHDLFTRMFESLVGRLHGPMQFRLILQPLMATIFAIRDGRRAAREGCAPYVWSLLTEPGRRRDLLRECWRSVGRVFVLAIVMDAIYQFIVVRWFYPGEALLVAFFLAVVPYVLIRGPVNRLETWMGRHTKTMNEPPPTQRRHA